jgi:hypothetical protein
LQYEELSSRRRMLDPYLWMVAVLIEHCILCLRFAVFSVVPATPGWIAKAKLQIEHTLTDRMMTEEEKALIKKEVRVPPPSPRPPPSLSLTHTHTHIHHIMAERC